MAPLGMAGSIMAGGHPNYDAVSISIAAGSPAAVDTNTPSPAQTYDWDVTVTNVVNRNLQVSDITLTASSGFATGTVTVINPTSATPTIRITGPAGTGWLSVHINADTYVNNDGDGNAQSAESDQVEHNPIAPVFALGAPSPSSAEEGSAVIGWAITYTGQSDVSDKSLATGDLTASYTGSTAGTWSVLNGTTATPTVRFTSTTGFGTVKFRINASASANWGIGNAQTAYSTAATITEDEGK